MKECKLKSISQFLIVLLVVISFIVPQIAIAADWKHYNNNPDFELTTLPNGAIANMQDLGRAASVLRMGIEAKAIPVTDNIWIISGYAYAPVVIETKEGLLVFSTGEHAEDGKTFRKIIREEISKKPVICVFYDHAHYPKGTKTLLDGDEAIIVAHPDHNAIVARSGGLANPNIAELLPNLDARAAIHLGTDIPKEGQDAAASPLNIELGQKSA